MVEKRYVNTAIILIDQKRRRINHKPNASPASARERLRPRPALRTESSMRNWRRSCEDCQSARAAAKLREPQDAARCDRASASAREQRTAKIAVDDAVLLHKFSSEISVDKFLAGIPFPQSQSLFVCVSVCVS